MNIGSFSWWFHEKFLNLQRIISKQKKYGQAISKKKNQRRAYLWVQTGYCQEKRMAGGSSSGRAENVFYTDHGVTCVVNFMHVEIEADGVMNFAAIIVQNDYC